jgi:hypothetical protein
LNKKASIDVLLELVKHPNTGTGQVEQLKGNMQGKWSRRIGGDVCAGESCNLPPHAAHGVRKSIHFDAS